MLTGMWLIVALVVAIAVMLLLISKYKVNAFVSMLLVSIVLAVFVLPIQDVAGTIADGFGATMRGIGIVIILGALIGFIVEKTGAALTIAETVVKAVGKKRPELAIMLMGWIVSIPVFCDSGFIILNPIRRSLAKVTKKSAVSMALALSLGLYTSHVLIPPTPGPIAAAGSVGLAENLLLVILVGAMVSVFALIPSFLFALYIGKKVTVEDDNEAGADSSAAVEDAFNELKKKYGVLPNPCISFAPIVVPILTMALGTIANMLQFPGLPYFQFIGAPIISLSIGTILSVVLLQVTGKIKDLQALTDDILKIVGPIIFITAAGGVLGRVISQAGIIDFVKGNLDMLRFMGILFPFAIAAILKIAQGSSTVAIVTTAAMMGLYTDPASVTSVLGFTTPMAAALIVMAIGAGSMIVSHANDSYFWVVSNLTGMTPEQGFKTQTLGSLVCGIGTIIGVLILSFIFV